MSLKLWRVRNMAVNTTPGCVVRVRKVELSWRLYAVLAVVVVVVAVAVVVAAVPVLQRIVRHLRGRWAVRRRAGPAVRVDLPVVAGGLGVPRGLHTVPRHRVLAAYGAVREQMSAHFPSGVSGPSASFVMARLVESVLQGFPPNLGKRAVEAWARRKHLRRGVSVSAALMGLARRLWGTDEVHEAESECIVVLAEEGEVLRPVIGEYSFLCGITPTPNGYTLVDRLVGGVEVALYLRRETANEQR